MPPRARFGIIPLELHFVVGRKGHGTTWTSQHNNQYRSTRLPEQQHPKIGVLDLSHIVLLDSPEPYHGLLYHATPSSKVSFEQILNVFTEAHSTTLKAENLTLSEESVRGFFFNYTNVNGLRVATPVFGPSENVADSSLFKSACLKENPVPCNCGCNQSHHGPSVFLVLDARSWEARNNGISEEPESHSMSFRDDPMAKVKEFSDSLLVPLVANQEIWIRSVNAVLAAERKDKANIQQKLEESDLENTELTNDVDRFVVENQKLIEKVEGLEITLESLNLENQKLKQSFDRKVTENEDLDLRLQAMNSDTRSQKEKYAKRAQDVITKKNKQLEVSNKELKAKVQKLETQVNKSSRKDNSLEAENKTLKAELPASKSNLEIMKQNYLRILGSFKSQVDDLKSRSETDLSQNKATTQKLIRAIRYLAFKDMVATKERTIINERLDNAGIHFRNNDVHMVLHEIDQLLNTMSTFPTAGYPAEDLENYVNDILNHVGYSPQIEPTAAPRPEKRQRTDAFPHNPAAYTSPGYGVLVNGNIPRPFSPLPAPNLASTFDTRYLDQVPR